MTEINEITLEQTALGWFYNLGYVLKFGTDLAFDGTHPKRKSEAQYSNVIRKDRLRIALHDVKNPNISQIAFFEDVLRKIIRTESPSLPESNWRFHRMLTNSMDIEVISEDEYDSVRHVEEAGV